MPLNLVSIYEAELISFYIDSFFNFPLSVTLSEELPLNAVLYLI
jgi:hypothetical protein